MAVFTFISSEPCATAVTPLALDPLLLSTGASAVGGDPVFQVGYPYQVVFAEFDFNPVQISVSACGPCRGPVGNVAY